MALRSLAFVLLGTVGLRPVAALQAVLLEDETQGGSAGARPVSAAALDWSSCRGLACVEKYVGLPEPSYSWHKLSSHPVLTGYDWTSAASWHATVYNMTSQRWLTEAEVSPCLWWHLLVVVEPSNLGVLGADTPDWGLLLVGQGSGKDMTVSPFSEELKTASAIAVRTGVRTAVVYQVPNSPVRFAGESEWSDEEEMKAKGWSHVIDNDARPDYAVELPMIRATVRAMDTVQAITSGSVRHFILSGFSKRGFTTWTTSAIDQRVKAVVVGCHALDLKSMMHDQFRSFYHAQIAGEPYVKMHLGRKEFRAGAELLFGMLDAGHSAETLSRLERLDKLVMEVGNDDFAVVDNAKHWLNRMKGPTSYIMHPNSGHLGKFNPALLSSTIAFLEGLLMKRPAPKISWQVDNRTGTLTARQESSHTPQSVRLWVADSCPATKRRDWRWLTADDAHVCQACGGTHSASICATKYSTWTSTSLQRVSSPDGRATWMAQLKAPARGGYRAGFVEFKYAGPRLMEQYTLTTEVLVTPAEYPFADCKGAACVQSREGVLVLLDKR